MPVLLLRSETGLSLAACREHRRHHSPYGVGNHDDWHWLNFFRNRGDPEVQALYERLRGGRLSPTTISNARFAVITINPYSRMRDSYTRNLAGYRLEMILDTGNVEARRSLDAMMWVKWKKDSEGLDAPSFVTVRRRVAAVRMTYSNGERVGQNVWSANSVMPPHDGSKAFVNTPYFLEQVLHVDGDDIRVLDTRLLGNLGEEWARMQVGYQLLPGNASVRSVAAQAHQLMNAQNPSVLSFPGRCSDASVRPTPTRTSRRGPAAPTG